MPDSLASRSAKRRITYRVIYSMTALYIAGKQIMALIWINPDPLLQPEHGMQYCTMYY